MTLFYRINLILFLLSIFFMRLPNIYILPFVQSGIFTTQGIARACIIVLFFTGLLFFSDRDIFFKKDSRTVTILILLFLLCSSLSILWAQNMDSFFTRYKDVFISILSFFVFASFAKERKKIIMALIIPMPINVVYQLLLLYGKSIFPFLQAIIYQKHFDLVSYNLYRGRIYTDVYDEAFMPLLLLLLPQQKNKLRMFSLLTVVCIVALAFLSNFRTRVLMLIVSVCSYFIFIQRVTIKKIFLLIFLLVVIAGLVSFISSFRYGYTFYDRFLLTNLQDIQSVFSRYEQIENALVMGLVSPFGVGLGNYFDMLLTQRSVYYAYINNNANSTAYEYVHNNFAIIIAESGYITCLIYILLLCKFIIMDKITMKGKDSYKKALVISFWTLFFFGLFNPPIPGSYQILFWGIRGLLI